MIRSELVEKLSVDHPHLSRAELAKIIDLFFTSITEQLREGGRVELRDFGIFSGRSRTARISRNPRSGAQVQVTAKRLPHFKCGKALAKRINSC
ncbi:HU family DNA-binding protein [Sphingobium sp. D43FB]|uniref:HU family DNA-binding protein n=1 Tax=Sphingobium sp. D43FB TaxID=2017595 RepID=UPI000BB53850|nr:HU family DNA-binding protein [Sphingobium sp. D43FB]PBN41600.1 integration host factor subunit beta [Sphingobium sp. D43FB]